MAYGKAK